MKDLDAYHIDAADADVVMEMIEDLRTRLAASELRERQLREACAAARAYIYAAPVKDRHWHGAVCQILDAALAGDK